MKRAFVTFLVRFLLHRSIDPQAMFNGMELSGEEKNLVPMVATAAQLQATMESSAWYRWGFNEA